MKEIKQKPAGGKPKTADAARVPKAVVKAAWLQAREAARAGEKQVVGGKDGAYSENPAPLAEPSPSNRAGK